MLASKHRFHRRNHVNRVYKQGESVRSGALSLKYRLDINSKDAKIAVVVSKKVAKSAVERNRIRRRVFETVRKRMDDLDPGFEGVFGVFDKSIGKLPQSDLEQQVQTLIKRTKQQ